MLLGKSFLLQALPTARFYCSGIESSWDFYGAEQEFNVAFDSRTVSKDSIFFALKGQKLDGHNFISQALEQGAAALVVSNMDCLKNTKLNNKLIILVPDTYQALIDLAKAWRTTLTCPIVGITGSIGKTSTKEILRSIMQQTGISSYFSAKNENTFIGLSAHILNIKSTHQAAILEVGTDQPGEMAIKADILRPTIALITTISYSHMAYFASQHNIASEKRQLFKNLGDSGIGIIPGDQPLLNNICYSHPIAMFGFKTKNNVQARKIKIVTAPNEEMYTTFTLKWYDQKADVKFNSIHQGMLNNVLAASTIAYMLKVPFNAVIQGIKQYTPFENRFQPRKIKATRSTVISDCYNANPDSMKAAIQAFDAIQTNSKKIAIIGDMRELGTREVYWHRLIGRMLCNASSIEQVILVGDLVKFVASVMPENMIAAKVQTWQEAEVILKKYLADHEALVLVKASHSIALDKLVDSIC